MAGEEMVVGHWAGAEMGRMGQMKSFRLPVYSSFVDLVNRAQLWR